MDQPDKVLDLDYDSPLENLFWFLGSPWCMGIFSLGTWFICVAPGKNGGPPIWADFPALPFLLGMSCVWALGYWLNANYDVRYQLDSRTQQLQLVRKIFGQTFKTRVADFSQLHATGVLSTWSDDKQGKRSWQYALCMITKTARVVRVSSFGAFAQNREAAEVAKNLGIVHFQAKEQAGTLTAKRDPRGEVVLTYKPPGRTVSTFTMSIAIIALVIFILLLVGWISAGFAR